MSSQCKQSRKPTPSNGRGNMPSTSKRHVLSTAKEDTSMVYPFSEEEYMKVVALLKTRKLLEEIMF